jgi:hypothetical protein
MTSHHRAIVAPVAIVLAIGLIFVSVYLAAFHAPRPHALPLAVVGTPAAAQHVGAALDRAQPGGFAVRGYASPADARSALEHRDVYGVVAEGPAGRSLLYAGANGSAVTTLLRQATRPAVAHDVVPAAAGDTRGLAIFYSVFGLVLAGFLFGSLTHQLAPHLHLRGRLTSLLLFGVAGGALITLVAKSYDALPGPSLGLAALVGLLAVAIGGASMTLVRLLGGAGVVLGAVLLLILGNSTSGGSLPAEFLPGWLHPLSEVLPVGVGVRAVDGVAYFHNDGLGTAIVVLAAWVVACLTLLRLRDGRRPGGPARVPAHAAPPAAAAPAAPPAPSAPAHRAA